MTLFIFIFEISLDQIGEKEKGAETIGEGCE
jgi:hypothetical protein